jgi:hypothetical protein
VKSSMGAYLHGDTFTCLLPFWGSGSEDGYQLIVLTKSLDG